MSTRNLLLALGGVLLLGTQPAICETQLQITAVSSFIKDCDSALVRATYNKIDFQFSDWRLAEKVDEGTYNQIKTDAGANAVIYGVPVGASYSNFQENIKSLKRDRQESYTSESFRNISWTGLDPNSVGPYQDCLKAAAVAARKSIVLLPERATATDISFKLFYTPSGSVAPNPVPVKWTIGEGSVASLPSKVPAGSTLIVVKRPPREVTLAVNAIAVGDSDSVVLTPLPKPLPPEARFASKCEITAIPDPRPTLAKGGSASWACPTMLAGNYIVTISITPGSNIPARVGYALDIVSSSGGVTKTIGLPLTSGNIIDINAEAGLPHVFQSIGGTISLPQGGALFQVSIGWIFNHCCFSGDGNAGVVTIPPNVTMKMERLEAVKPQS